MLTLWARRQLLTQNEDCPMRPGRDLWDHILLLKRSLACTLELFRLWLGINYRGARGNTEGINISFIHVYFVHNKLSWVTLFMQTIYVMHNCDFISFKPITGIPEMN